MATFETPYSVGFESRLTRSVKSPSPHMNPEFSELMADGFEQNQKDAQQSYLAGWVDAMKVMDSVKAGWNK